MGCVALQNRLEKRRVQPCNEALIIHGARLCHVQTVEAENCSRAFARQTTATNDAQFRDIIVLYRKRKAPTPRAFELSLCCRTEYGSTQHWLEGRFTESWHYSTTAPQLISPWRQTVDLGPRRETGSHSSSATGKEWRYNSHSSENNTRKR